AALRMELWPPPAIDSNPSYRHAGSWRNQPLGAHPEVEVNRAMGRCFCCLPLVAALGLGITPAKEAEPVKKFPQPGANLPGSFSPLIINGGWKDKDGKPLYRHRSPVAHFGLRPVVLVFARDFRDDVVMDFLKKLEARLEAHPAEDLRAAAIFLCHDD